MSSASPVFTVGIALRQWVAQVSYLAWRAFRPLGVMLLAAAVGLLVAITLWSLLRPALLFVTELLDWIVKLLEPHVTGLSAPNIDKVDSVGVGIGAFGAVVVLSVLKDTHENITKVALKWMSADRTVLLPAFFNLVVAFGALGLSVYAIATQKAASPMIAFDASSIPPAVVNPEDGRVTFYASFLKDGGEHTLLNAEDDSIRLRPSDAEFLESLTNGFRICIQRGTPPVLSVRGFASTSKWRNAAQDLNELIRENPGKDSLSAAHARINEYAKNDAAFYRLNPSEAVARAFNVYLANRRRDAALAALNAGGATFELRGSGWNSYEEMDNAQVIEDHGAKDQTAAAGILSRSVAVTIEDPGGCSRSINRTRVELGLPQR